MAGRSGKTPETEITYQVEDGAHQPIRFQYVATRRDDVSQIYFGRTVEKELGLISSSRMSAEKIII